MRTTSRSYSNRIRFRSQGNYDAVFAVVNDKVAEILVEECPRMEPEVCAINKWIFGISLLASILKIYSWFLRRNLWTWRPIKVHYLEDFEQLCWCECTRKLLQEGNSNFVSSKRISLWFLEGSFCFNLISIPHTYKQIPVFFSNHNWIRIIHYLK